MVFVLIELNYLVYVIMHPSYVNGIILIVLPGVVETIGTVLLQFISGFGTSIENMDKR